MRTSNVRQKKVLRRSTTMRYNNPSRPRLFALAFILVTSSLAYASGRAAGPSPRPQEAGARSVASGEQFKKYRGIVTKRSPDTFVMRDDTGALTVVALTPQTEAKSHKKGAFRGSKDYGVSYILRGLRLEVDGTGNDEGQIVADKIRFDEQDLRAAQALQATLDTVEENANARMAATEENAKRMSGQIEENTALANNAQASADAAMKSATLANDRINGLDEFDPVKTVTVLFATGSSTLGPKGKAVIDEAAAWVRTQNTKGWVVAVVGFADTSGNTEKNRSLSERRSNAVIGYLVTKHNLPLQRLVQPFGYGDSNPVADNSTTQGRAQNRRVEIRLLVNKGIARTAQTTP
jgi:outer membrane protein OmpA-like peptidoglycan-associated protein